MKTVNKLYLLFSFLLMGIAVRSQTIAVWKLNDLKSAIEQTNQPTIINFWATFCKPCIAELPHFQLLANKYKEQGVKLILVSLDLKEAYPNKVASFSKKLRLTSTVIYLDESNADLFCPVVDSSWSGAIPASIFLNNQTDYRKFFEKELTKEELETEIKLMLRKGN